MIILNNGSVQFGDITELYYNLFNEIGLSINAQQYLYDQDTGITLRYKDKYLKATTTIEPIYAGKSDIVFDPASNFNCMVTLFGYFIEKISINNNFPYKAQYVEDNPDKTKQRLVVQTLDGKKYTSKFYNNLYLGFIEVIFQISDISVNLENFDNVK